MSLGAYLRETDATRAKRTTLFTFSCLHHAVKEPLWNIDALPLAAKRAPDPTGKRKAD